MGCSRGVNYCVFILLLSLVFIISCSYSGKNKTKKFSWSDTSSLSLKEKQLKSVWDRYKIAIQKNDSLEIIKLSFPCINCPDCQSPQAYSQTNPASEHDTVYHGYVPLNIFMSEDIKNTFNDFALNESNIQLIEQKNSGYIHENGCIDSALSNSDCIEVVIADKSCTGEECSQAIYRFINTNEGYKFYGIFHVP